MGEKFLPAIRLKWSETLGYLGGDRKRIKKYRKSEGKAIPYIGRKTRYTKGCCTVVTAADEDDKDATLNRAGQTLRIPDNRLMKVARKLALGTGRLHPPGNIPGTHFC